MIHLGETGLKKFKDNQVDYIIMRDVYLVNSPVTKWISLFKEIHRILKPGGYIEIYEHGNKKKHYSPLFYYILNYLIDVTYKSIGPYFTIMEEWADRLYEAIKFDRNTNNQLGSFLQDTGYVNIQHEHKDLPIGEWPADKGKRFLFLYIYIIYIMSHLTCLYNYYFSAKRNGLFTKRFN